MCKLLCNERAGIRTPDNLIKSQVLYRLSYTPLLYWASWIRTSEMQESKSCALPLGDGPLLCIFDTLGKKNASIAACSLYPYTGWIEGFEPSASRATIWRANQLRYTHHKTCLEGFEPPTHGLEGRCSIQLSYKHIASLRDEAGDGNRTHVSSLEGWCSTIELHPQASG